MANAFHKQPWATLSSWQIDEEQQISIPGWKDFTLNEQ